MQTQYTFMAPAMPHVSHAAWQERNKQDWTLGELCSVGAALTPDAPALSDGVRSFGFGELDQLIQDWAAYLHRAGVRNQRRVVVLADKRVHSVVALLAVCRAGATYVALDGNLPAARLDAIIAEVAPACIIASNTTRNFSAHPSCSRLDLESFEQAPPVSGLARPRRPNPEDVAYIMYTSGSTGRPKGVEITHRAIRRFFREHNRSAGIGPADRCMNTSPFHFDVSIMDVFLPLYFGASVFLTGELPLPSVLLRTLEEQRITTFYAVGTVLQLLTGDGDQLDRHDLSNLRLLQTGAEVCNVRVVNEWLSRFSTLQFLNSYGPTEVTVGCFHYLKTAPGLLPETDCPIGKPHIGTVFHLQNDAGQFISSPFQTGELLIAGDQLMRGYWAQPDEDARTQCMIHGQLYYRTGDYVYWDADGLLHYIGRRDDEVKIDGQRIHLNEVRAALAQCPEVRASTAGTLRDATGRLRIAVAVCTGPEADTELAQNILTQLAALLPAAAHPVALLLCTDLPRLTSGKTDVRSCMQFLENALRANSGRRLFRLTTTEERVGALNTTNQEYAHAE